MHCLMKAPKSLKLEAVATLTAMLAMTSALAQTKVVPTHCKPDERVVFSCPFKHGKTASLCASADLTKTTGTLQYRYGVIDKTPELVYPKLGEYENPVYDHPSRNFDWYSSLSIPMPNGSIGRANTKWSTKNVPTGDGVRIYLNFSPIDENPAINFTIQAEAGFEASYQGAMLLITESVGPQGRPIAGHRCIKEKTTEDLFSLKDIIQK